jgi:hypothetical protein
MNVFLIILMMCGEPNIVIFQNIYGQQYVANWSDVENNEALANELSVVMGMLPEDEEGNKLNALRIPMENFNHSKCM